MSDDQFSEYLTKKYATKNEQWYFKLSLTQEELDRLHKSVKNAIDKVDEEWKQFNNQGHYMPLSKKY